MAVYDYLTYLIAVRTMQAAGMTLAEPINMMCLSRSSYRKALTESVYANLLRVGCETGIRWNYSSMRINIFKGMDWHQAREAIEAVEEEYADTDRSMSIRPWSGYWDLQFPVNEDELRETMADIRKIVEFIEYKKTHGIYPSEVREIKDEIAKVKKEAKTVSAGQKRINAILKARGFKSTIEEAVDNE